MWQMMWYIYHPINEFYICVALVRIQTFYQLKKKLNDDNWVILRNFILLATQLGS